MSAMSRLPAGRRRSLAGGAVVGAVALGLVLTTLDLGAGRPTQSVSPSAPVRASSSPAVEPTPVPAPLSATTGTRLVVVQGTRLELLDVDTGRRTLLPTDPRLLGGERIDVAAVAGQLVMLDNDNTGAGNGPVDVFATTAGPGSALRKIGAASHVMASSHADRVWLVSAEERDMGPTSTFIEVGAAGRVYRRASVAGWGAVPFADGFLRATVQADGSSGDDTELVDARGTRLRRYAGRVLAVRASTAILSEANCTNSCDLRVLSAGSFVRERTVRAVALPPLPDDGWALTADAAHLFAARPVNEGSSALRITDLDLRTGASRDLAGAWAARYFGPSATLSDDGRFLFFIDAAGTHIDAYDLGTGQAVRVGGTFATITQLARAG